MMKKIFILLLPLLIIYSYQYAIACANDCSSCHYKIEEKEGHEILATCKTCHQDNVENQDNDLFIFEFKPNKHNACGGSCLQCHDKFPNNNEHIQLNKCKDCHA
jgi:hypothetical protein